MNGTTGPSRPTEREQSLLPEHGDGVFQALAAQPRRDLLVLLAQGDAPVGELADHFDISRPAVSKHLSVLKQAGLVASRAEGRKNVYRLEHEPLQEVLAWLVELDRFWAEHLDDVEANLPDEDE